MLNQYVLQKEIGRGAYGTVLQAVDSTTGKEYAIKEFSKARLRKRNHSAILRRPRGGLMGAAAAAGNGGPRAPRRPQMQSRRSATDIHKDEEAGNPLFLIRSELAIMKKLDHENVIDLLEVLDDPEGDALYMVLELCKKGVIMQIGFGANAEPFTDEECRHYFRDLILGIEYLHAQGIAHRDVKPDNLLLSSDSVLKIADFGVSELFQLDDDQKVAQSGSPAFMSPELCHGARNTSYLKASDIWSMGVTLFCFKFGTLPFGETNLIELCADIMNKPPILLDPSFPGNKRHTCDENLLDLFDRILEKDPEQRITMEELREHPWVTCDGEDELLSAEENTAQMIQEITEEDLREAIKGIRGAVTVVKAVFKLKQMREAKSREASPHGRSVQDDAERSRDEPTSDAESTADAEKADQKLLADKLKDAKLDGNNHTRLERPPAATDASPRGREPGHTMSESTVPHLQPVSPERTTRELPRPTIAKRSRSMDAASVRMNGTEDRILWHTMVGIEPGREQFHNVSTEEEVFERWRREADLTKIQRACVPAPASADASASAKSGGLARARTQMTKRGSGAPGADREGRRRERQQQHANGDSLDSRLWRRTETKPDASQDCGTISEISNGVQPRHQPVGSNTAGHNASRAVAKFQAALGNKATLGNLPKPVETIAEQQPRPSTEETRQHREPVRILNVGAGKDYKGLIQESRAPALLAESPGVERTGVSLQGKLREAYEALVAKDQLRLAQTDTNLEE
jgi:serine/threonine protein kinase